MKEVYKQSIKELKGSSKELFNCLNYILQDEELALGYLGLFEKILEKECINAKIFALKESLKGEYTASGLIGYYKHELSNLNK